MSAATLPPPPPAVCLTRSYTSSGIKGGTIIDERTLDLETHHRKLLDRASYRAVIGACSACHCPRVHALCFRERVLRGAGPAGPLVVTVRLYRCARAGCGAVFTVLPAVIARHLWRLWETVEAPVGAGTPPTPTTTRRRWLARLGSSAAQLVQTLTTRASSYLAEQLLEGLPEVRTRRDLLELTGAAILRAPASILGFLCAWIHRLEPGIRVL